MSENINEVKIDRDKYISKSEKAKNYEQNKVCIWNVSNGIKIGIGFLSTILYNAQSITILITNYHIINDEFIKNNKQIKILINKEEKSNIINIDERNKIYSSPKEKYDIMILQIKETKIPNYYENFENNDSSFFAQEFKNLFDKGNKKIIFDNSSNISKIKESILSVVLNGFIKDIKDIMNWDQELKNRTNEKFKNIFDILIEPILLNNNIENNLNLFSIIDKYLCTKNIFYIFLCIYPKNQNLLLNMENNKKYIIIIERLFDVFKEKKIDIFLYLIELIKMEIEIQVNVMTEIGVNRCIKILKSNTIKAIKEKFEKETKITPENLIILWNGQLLSEKKLVDDYNIKNNDIILLASVDRLDFNINFEKTIYNEEEKNWVIYALELIYKLSIKNKYILKSLIQEDIIITFLYMLNNSFLPNKNIIYNILLLAIKNITEYNNIYFDLDVTEQNGKIYWTTDFAFLNDFVDDKNKNYNETFEKMFEEKPDLFKIFIKLVLIKDYNRNIDKVLIIIDKLFKKHQDKQKNIYQLIDLITSLILINDENTLRRYIKLFGYPTLYISPIPKENKEKQKWPLFGERLINGDINQEIYEYIIPDHDKNYLCLLSILFPSKYHPHRKIKIKEEQKRKILLNFIKCIYDDRNNYTLFKYLYTMPSRSLKYLNLYDEIIEYLDIYNLSDHTFNIEIMKNKEIKYKTQVEEEIKNNIKNAIEKDNNKKNDENSFEFNYEDLDIDKFNGFIAQIIPGEIIREEIYGITKNDNNAIYKIHYYTKYYKLNDLREKLLNNKKIEEEDKKEGNLEQEIIISELEESPNIVKYDISKKTENSIIYRIYNDNNKNFIIEDKTRVNENNVKNTLIRYILTNKGEDSKNYRFNTKFKYFKIQQILNSFNPNIINDSVNKDDIKSFMILQRLRDDLDFLNYNISISFERILK